MTLTAQDTTPICPCCNGAGTHAYRAYARGASPGDDDEGCTLCGERGRTWHNGRPDSCSGARDLRRRTR